MNKTTIKYFNQKAFGIIDKICIALTAISAVMFIFAGGMGFISLPMLMITVIFWIAYSSSKIKDSDIDDITKKFVHLLEEAASSRCEKADDELSTYIFDESRKIKKGRDGKYRSDRFCLIQFRYKADRVLISKFEYDLTNDSTDKKEFEVPYGSKLTETEKSVNAGNAHLNIGVLAIDSAPDFSALFDLKDSTFDIIAEKVLNGHTL